MSWEIKYKRIEKFIYKHSNLWPLKKLKQIKRINKLKAEIEKENVNDYDKIIIGQDFFQPESVNINLIIHVGELEKLKQHYNKLVEKNIKMPSYNDPFTDFNNFKKSPLHENIQYSDLDGLEFEENKFFDRLACSINRVSESFIQISFRFRFTEKIFKEFNQILTSYKQHKYKIINFKLTKMNSSKNKSVSIIDNRSLTQHEIAIFLKNSRNYALSIIGKSIVNLHVGDTDSIFSLYAFSYIAKEKDKSKSDCSLFYQLNLGVRKDGFGKFSTDKDEITLLFNHEVQHALAPNSEMIFFNSETFSEENLQVYGGDFRNVVSHFMRLYVELTISHDFSIFTILLHYYEVITKYRFHKYRSYTFFPCHRYKKFLKETHFLKAFINEYNFDKNLRKYNYENYLGEFNTKRYEGKYINFYEIIYDRIGNQVSAIHALESSITDIVNSQKDNAIIRTNRELQIIVIVITLVSILNQCCLS